jgi:hypothetical protein
MNSEQQKIDILEQTYKRNSGYFLKEATNNKELHLATGDEKKAAVEQLKIEGMETAWQTLDRAKQMATLEEAKEHFLTWLETYRQDLQTSVAEARAKGDKETLINAQIRLNLTFGPIPGFFSYAFKQASAEVNNG